MWRATLLDAFYSSCISNSSSIITEGEPVGPLAVEEYFFLLPAYSGRHIGLPLHCSCVILCRRGAPACAPIVCVFFSFCSFVFKLLLYHNRGRTRGTACSGGVFLPLACVFGQTHRSAPTLRVVAVFPVGAHRRVRPFACVSLFFCLQAFPLRCACLLTAIIKKGRPWGLPINKKNRVWGATPR